MVQVAARRFVLTTGMQSRAPLDAPVGFVMEWSDPHRVRAGLMVRWVSYSAGQSGWGKKSAWKSCCAREGKYPFPCIVRPQWEFLCCQWARETMLLQTTEAPGIIPFAPWAPRRALPTLKVAVLCCALNQQEGLSPCHHLLHGLVLLPQPVSRAREMIGR